MTDAPYGYCPFCAAPGERRERRPNGIDRCENGHTYPSFNARSTPHRPDTPCGACGHPRRVHDPEDHNCEAHADVGLGRCPCNLFVSSRGEAMTAEPCPNCKGRCCRDEFGYRVVHMGAEHYQHDCDACEDGTKYVPPRTAEDERADVLAWLHDRVAKSYGVGTVPGTFGYNDRAIAEAFERGEHVGWAKRVKP